MSFNNIKAIFSGAVFLTFFGFHSGYAAIVEPLVQLSDWCSKTKTLFSSCEKLDCNISRYNDEKSEYIRLSKGFKDCLTQFIEVDSKSSETTYTRGGEVGAGADTLITNCSDDENKRVSNYNEAIDSQIKRYGNKVTKNTNTGAATFTCANNGKKFVLPFSVNCDDQKAQISRAEGDKNLSAALKEKLDGWETDLKTIQSEDCFGKTDVETPSVQNPDVSLTIPVHNEPTQTAEKPDKLDIPKVPNGKVCKELTDAYKDGQNRITNLLNKIKAECVKYKSKTISEISDVLKIIESISKNIGTPFLYSSESKLLDCSEKNLLTLEITVDNNDTVLRYIEANLDKFYSDYGCVKKELLQNQTIATKSDAQRWCENPGSYSANDYEWVSSNNPDGGVCYRKDTSQYYVMGLGGKNCPAGREYASSGVCKCNDKSSSGIQFYLYNSYCYTQKEICSFRSTKGKASIDAFGPCSGGICKSQKAKLDCR